MDFFPLYHFYNKTTEIIFVYSIFFCFHRIYFTSNDWSQNTFVYQPTVDTLELKKDKSTDCVLGWKSKGVFNSKRKPLYTSLFYSIKHSQYRTGIKFDPLAYSKTFTWQKL